MFCHFIFTIVFIYGIVQSEKAGIFPLGLVTSINNILTRWGTVMFYKYSRLIIAMKYSLILDVTICSTEKSSVVMRKKIQTVKDIVPLVFGEIIIVDTVNQHDCLRGVVFKIDGLESRVIEGEGPPFPAEYSVQNKIYHASASITVDPRDQDSTALNLAVAGFLLLRS